MISNQVGIPGYIVNEQLYDGSRTLVYRAVRKINDLPVVIVSTGVFSSSDRTISPHDPIQPGKFHSFASLPSLIPLNWSIFSSK
ncbi:hypothetical protein [Nostoc sp.]|uniref:hypothetical protein n=1 Tax=Nostoc sp. TaxID=1180 RepID=UPI002FFB62DB